MRDNFLKTLQFTAIERRENGENAEASERNVICMILSSSCSIAVYDVDRAASKNSIYAITISVISSLSLLLSQQACSVLRRSSSKTLFENKQLLTHSSYLYSTPALRLPLRHCVDIVKQLS